MSAVEVTGLRKSYGSNNVLCGVDMSIGVGEVFALLGPNGAGKTTTVEILEGYRKRDAGSVSVLGTDPANAGPGFKGRIGIVLQSTAVYPRLQAREMLETFGRYYPRRRDVDEVLELIGLQEHASKRVRTLSGGQLRRLDLGLALIGDPELLFLDEPTTGFDPSARRRAWETIQGLKELGKTVLLTTHYLDEAHQLADRIAILRGGQIVALGSPAELLATNGTTEVRYQRDGETVIETTDEPTRFLHELTGEALAAGVELEGLVVERPTLEDLYIEMTEEKEA